MLCLFFLISVLADFRVDQDIMDDFYQWHFRSISEDQLNHRPKPVGEVYPGMSRATQVLPRKVKNFLISQLKAYSLTDDEWAMRWKRAEALLLVSMSDALGVLTVLEQLGQEAFADMVIKEGFVSEKIPKLQGAKSARFFLMSNRDRQKQFELIVKETFGHQDERLSVLRKIIDRDGLVKALSNSQKDEFSIFLLEVYDQFKSRNDLHNVKRSFVKTMEDNADHFKKELGYELPSPERILGVLQKLKAQLQIQMVKD